MTKETLELEGLKKIRSDFQFLMARFKEMLQSLGEDELAALISAEDYLFYGRPSPR